MLNTTKNRSYRFVIICAGLSLAGCMEEGVQVSKALTSRSAGPTKSEGAEEPPKYIIGKKIVVPQPTPSPSGGVILKTPNPGVIGAVNFAGVGPGVTLPGATGIASIYGFDCPEGFDKHQGAVDQDDDQFSYNTVHRCEYPQLINCTPPAQVLDAGGRPMCRVNIEPVLQIVGDPEGSDGYRLGYVCSYWCDEQ